MASIKTHILRFRDFMISDGKASNRSAVLNIINPTINREPGWITFAVTAFLCSYLIVLHDCNFIK